MDPTSRRFVCITGMHRSGTSLLSRMINLLGVDLGDDPRLSEGAADNERGFWELRALRELNDALLHHLGGSWDDPPLLPAGWHEDPGLDHLRRDAEGIIEAHFQPGGVAGWKDPRTSLTLPFWRTVVEVDRTLLAIRRPSDVAASLRERNGLDIEVSARLWLTYTLRAHLHDPQRTLVGYEETVEQPRSAASRVGAALGLPEPSERTLERVEAFASPRLMHHASDPVTPSPSLELARAVHELLMWADDQTVTDVARVVLPMTGRHADDHDAVRNVAGIITRLNDEQRRRSATEAQVEEILARRSVRTALAIASAARPLLRLVRRE